MRNNDRSKHIVLVIKVLNGRSGGAERIYCELANLLQDSGYRVTCLHFDSKGGTPFYRLDHSVERINLHRKPSPWDKRRAAVAKYLPRKMRDKVDWDLKYDFFISQLRDYFTLVKPDFAISILPTANTPTLLAAAGTTVKVIACNHNVPEQDYENPKRWGSNPIDRKQRLAALDTAAAIHVLFPDFATWFPAHLQQRIVAIPNYISPSFSWPNPRPPREKTVLAVGRLAEVKNYRALIASWSTLANEFPDWKVKIFGTGPQFGELTSEVLERGLAGKVELLGHQSDLSSEYAKASVFCHPALFEGFGLSAAEALFLETPVLIYSDCQGVNEFVKDGYNGLAVERNEEEDSLAIGLRRLMADEKFRTTLGRNGPESISIFTFEKYKERWLNLIKTMEGAN